MREENPFSLPGSYFESFPRRLQQRLDTEKAPVKPSRIKAWEVIRPHVALAAAITGFAILGYLILQTFVSHEQEPAGNDLIAEYIDYHQHQFSEYQFLVLLEEHENFPGTDPLHENGLLYSSPELYMDYLYEDNIDIGLIMSEF